MIERTRSELVLDPVKKSSISNSCEQDVAPVRSPSSPGGKRQRGQGPGDMLEKAITEAAKRRAIVKGPHSGTTSSLIAQNRAERKRRASGSNFVGMKRNCVLNA